MSAPERIWLYVDTDDYGERYIELINEDAHSQTDVEYIRADLAAAKDARIAELERQLAEAREVKPLEWKDGDRNGGFYAPVPIRGLFSAYYGITQEDFGLATVEFGIHCHEFGGDIIWKGPTQNAKAAAQADYTARILSALKETP